MSRAMFGAGCFWGVETAFWTVPGVIGTKVGYAGGTTQNPTYKDVCAKSTGHAEVVLVDFDPAQVSYPELLSVFWKAHDPTQRNRQGWDVGDQYRSVIFFYDTNQGKEALTSRDVEQEKYAKPIVTQILPAPEFWEAEEYHQRYYEKHGIASCPIPQN